MPAFRPSSSSSSTRLLRSTSKATSFKKPSSKTLFPSIPSLLSKLPGIPSLLARIPGLGKTAKEESPRLYPRMFSLIDSAPLEPILEIDIDSSAPSPVSPPSSPANLDATASTVPLHATAPPSTPASPASLSDEDDDDDDEATDDSALPFTPVNVRDHSDGIFSATFTQQVANQWDELAELRKQKRTAKTVMETRHEERLFTIARGRNAYALVVPFGDKPMKAPLHEELRFPPTDEQLTVIQHALGRAYEGKLADRLKNLESFERTLHHLQFGGGNTRRSLLETHAFLRSHVPGYGKGRKRTDLEQTLAIVRKLRPASSPVSPEPEEVQSDDASTDAPWEVQEFRRRSGKKTAAAQIDGSTPWAAPERRGLRPISLRMKEEKEEGSNTKRRPAKRRKLSFK